MKQFLTHSKPKIFLIMLTLLLICSFLAPTSLYKDYKPRLDVETEFTDDDVATSEYPNLVISAINPGYKTAEGSDDGELIELRNISATPLPLDGISLRYTNGSGTPNDLYQFPDGSVMLGEYLVLSYKNSPNNSYADTTYESSLALSAGPLELLYKGEVVDSICWAGGSACEKPFKTASPTTLIRDFETGKFIHQTNYLANFSEGEPQLYLPPEIAPEPAETPDDKAELVPSEQVGACSGIEFTEVYSYYNDVQTSQFIELYNRSNKVVDLANCQIRYKKKTYTISGNISPDEYFSYYPKTNFSLTKNPTSSNTVELIDLAGELVDELIYPNGQKKSASYAKFLDFDGSESWAITYHVTPGQPNVFQEFRTCPADKIINPETGNCVNATSISSLTAECPAGKYRNPLTGRCKNIESASSTELKPCAEGYERNPETNRCRKIKTENTGADYALVPMTSTSKTRTSFIAVGIVIAIILVGVVYVILQFRHEIARATRKTAQRLNHFLKDLVSGKIGLHRKKDP